MGAQRPLATCDSTRCESAAISDDVAQGSQCSIRMTQDHHAPLVGRALLLARRSLRRARGTMTRRQLTWLALFGGVLGFAFGPRLLALLT
jgi:hypothetical protein